MDAPTKRCSRGDRCIHPEGCELPATTDYFPKNRSKKDGLGTECHYCNRARVRGWTKEHPEQVAEGKRLYADRHPDRIKASRRRWRVNNPEKEKEYSRRRYWRNPEAQRQRARERYANLSEEQKRQVIAKSVQATREWREKNHERYKAREREYTRKNADKARQRAKAWRQSHVDWVRGRHKREPIKNRLYGDRRRTLKLNLPFTLTETHWQRDLEYFKHKCAVCGKSPDFWTIIAKDHWIPLSAPNCPGTTPDNCIPLCHSIKDGESGCNNRKHKRNPEEWLIEQFGARKAKQILNRINTYFEWVRQQDM